MQKFAFTAPATFVLSAICAGLAFAQSTPTGKTVCEIYPSSSPIYQKYCGTGSPDVSAEAQRAATAAAAAQAAERQAALDQQRAAEAHNAALAQEAAEREARAHASFIKDRDAATALLRGVSTSSSELRGVNTSSTQLRGVGTFDPMPVAQKSDAAFIRLRIAGIQNALRQLNKAMNLDASQRQEWEEKSAEASWDAWAMAGSLALEGMSHALDGAIASTEEDINDAVRLHRKVKPLREKKAALERIRDNASEMKSRLDDAVSAKTVVTSSAFESKLEVLWKEGEELGLVPPLAKWAKSTLDASYLTAVQAASVLRIEQLNSNQDQYLAAVRLLKMRMELLVKLSK